MKTDSQLQQDVMAELKWEPAVDAAQIGVAVKDGVVSLSGEVGSFAEKWEAERVTLRVGGVKALSVGLEVRLTELGRRSDADIARSAENVLDWMTSLRPESIKVMVEGGWITLSGDVDWQYQKSAAAEGLRNLAGVTGLSNQISLNHPATAPVVKADIEAALKRRAREESADIKVAVDQSSVTLTGDVRSWAERELVISSAWGSTGVQKVVDKLTLVD